MVDRRAFRTSHPRHARTRLAAVLLCAGLGVTSAPHAMAAPNDDPNSVASLANDLTQAQKKLTELQNEQGGIHQEANKTVYELDEATSDANDAQEKVVQARARLDKSEKDVEEAQDKLNSLSRSQYTQGQDSNAVTMAAGEDAVANTLDRASYLRTEAAKQRKVVSQLDKVRTQAANEESSLRKLLADASAKRKDAKESKDKALEAIQTASRKAADLQKSIQEAEARKNEIQSRLDEVKGDKAGSSSNSTAAPAQNNASDTSAVGPSTSASATQDTKPASDSASPANNATDNQDNSSDSASSDDQSSTNSAPTTEQLAYDTANDGDAGTGEPTQESTEPSSDTTEQSSSNDSATASSENSAQDQQDSAQNDQADSSSSADNGDDQGAKADQGIDYAAADQTEKERSEAATDAKQKADNALAAAKDAKEKEDNGDPTVEQARQNAANLATIASEAVKRVEELTEKLRQILGAAFDSSSNDADKALIGLTSSGLAALAAGLKAGQEGNDPVAAAVNGGRQAARQAWDQIQNQSDNSGNTNNTGSANTGSGSASTATGTTGNGTGSDNSGSTASGSSSTGFDNTNNDQSGSSTSSGSTGSSSNGTGSDGSDSDDSSSDDESTSTTSQLVNGLKNNSDALNRVTDGTDQASLATSIGGGNSANSSTTGTTNTGDNAQTATSGSAETRINAVIARAQSQLGVRYSWGGGNYYGPTVGIRDGGVADQYGDYAHAGFDCSGLVLYAFYIAGFKLPHYTGAQYQSGTQYPASQMKRGDLIFYGPNASQHVAIYLGNDQMIEAPESGSVVKISPVRYGGMTPNVVRLIS